MLVDCVPQAAAVPSSFSVHELLPTNCHQPVRIECTAHISIHHTLSNSTVNLDGISGNLGTQSSVVYATSPKRSPLVIANFRLDLLRDRSLSSVARDESRMTGNYCRPEESIHRCVRMHSHLYSCIYGLVALLDIYYQPSLSITI